jgi:large-conductance mechanosensitive channel
MSILNNGIEFVKMIIDKFNAMLAFVLNLLITQSEGFIKFLIKQNILQIGIGLLLAVQLTNITKVITEQLISPIAAKISIIPQKKLEDYKISILGSEIKIGIIIQNLINFALIIVIVWLIYEFIVSANFDVVSKLASQIKSNKVVFAISSD